MSGPQDPKSPRTYPIPHGTPGHTVLTVHTGGGTGASPHQKSLRTIKSIVSDPNAFRGGKPIWKSVTEFDRYLNGKGFRLASSEPMGPMGLRDGQQLIYEGPDNVIVKIKTRGYSDGAFAKQRIGVPTMSIEATTGPGKTGWEDALFKVDSNGKILAKRVSGSAVEIDRLPDNHEARAKARQANRPEPEFGFVRRDGKLDAVTNFELIDGNPNAKPTNVQKWADAGHMNLPEGFDPAGADQLAAKAPKKPTGGGTPPRLPPKPPPGPVATRIRMARTALKAGVRGAFTASNLASMIPDIVLVFADRAAAMDAIKKIQTKFLKEGFAKGVAAGVTAWNEEEVQLNLFNKVSSPRVHGMGDAAGSLTRAYILQLAENCENYGVEVGFLYSEAKDLAWKRQLLDKGLAALVKHGYRHLFDQTRNPNAIFEYEFIEKLAWVLQPTTNAIVEPAIRFTESD